ncbi:hypothetical protein JKA73_17680 [Myxococcus xanthus]|uniref:hypothetical protein n=1 Tax=Myxococcus xanthus TaxID=34 RepID=UPI0019178C43|nr:hypothetical protein [Myxococcus xanthus]QQR47767.1 hypothetical protein JKA73_17680 [Myxococcus xanthus]
MSDCPTPPLAPSDELLFRQIPGRSGYINDGTPTSMAFKPLPKDEGELSVDLGSLTTAEASFNHFTQVVGGQSSGVWAVTTNECKSQELDAYHRPKADHPPNPTHGIVDFRHLGSDNKMKKKAAKLVEAAIKRGCQWPLSPANATTCAGAPQTNAVSATATGAVEPAPPLHSAHADPA